jgi:hypothetical protein
MNPKLDTLIRAATDAVLLLERLADDAEAAGDLQQAHYIRHRSRKLDDASADALVDAVENMTDEELDADLRAKGLDPDEVAEEGRRMVVEIIARHARENTSVRDTPDFDVNENGPF